MIVHWFIEPVSYGKESASDIENPFENKKCATQFCYKTLETDFKELKIFASHKNNFASDFIVSHITLNYYYTYLNDCNYWTLYLNIIIYDW